MMSSASALFSAGSKQLRLYSFAVLVYIGIVSLVAMPAIERAHTRADVKSNLAQYLEQSNAARTSSNKTLLAEGIPASISINRLGINLPVAPGYYNLITRKWTLDDSHVFVDSYSNANPVIGVHEPQTTFLYGHDIPGVLIKTAQLTYGDIMTVNTQNGYQFRYYYDKSKVIPPTDTSVLDEKNTGDQLAMATCTGEWYQFRHVMYFHLLSIQQLPSGPVEKVAQ